MSLSLKHGWNQISENYQQRSGIPIDDVYWGDFVPTESQLRILGDVREKRILEIGCGGAQNSIALSKWGARTFGVDLSRKQILYGKKIVRSEVANTSLSVCNMEQLPFKDGSFDIVMTAVSLLYAPDLNAVIAEANRVFVVGGHLSFSAEHPFSEGKLVKYRGTSAVALKNYFKRRIVRWIDKLPDGSRVRMHSHYRTLQDYFDALTKNGFNVERYVELERLQESNLHPLDRDKIRRVREAKRQYRIMKEVPYWIIFKACKKACFSACVG